MHADKRFPTIRNSLLQVANQSGIIYVQKDLFLLQTHMYTFTTDMFNNLCFAEARSTTYANCIAHLIENATEVNLDDLPALLAKDCASVLNPLHSEPASGNAVKPLHVRNNVIQQLHTLRSVTTVATTTVTVCETVNSRSFVQTYEFSPYLTRIVWFDKKVGLDKQVIVKSGAKCASVVPANSVCLG